MVLVDEDDAELLTKAIETGGLSSWARIVHKSGMLEVRLPSHADQMDLIDNLSDLGVSYRWSIQPN